MDPPQRMDLHGMCPKWSHTLTHVLEISTEASENLHTKDIRAKFRRGDNQINSGGGEWVNVTSLANASGIQMEKERPNIQVHLNTG